MPVPGTYAQDVLDELLALAPAKALSMAADILDPGSGATSHLNWVTKELPHVFNLPLGPHQRWLLDEFQMKQHGIRVYLAAPRGSGKTALSLMGIPLSAISQGTHEFVVIIRNSQTEAEAGLDMIRSELENNSGLLDKWPRLRYIKKSGSHKRHKIDTRREVALAGGRILALGAGSKMRGLLRENSEGRLIRPDLIILDDVDDDEQARSKLRTDRLEEWLFSNVLFLGSGMKPVSLLGIGTTITADALCTRAITNKGRFKNWTTAKFPAIIKNANGSELPMWPEGMPLPYLKNLQDPNSDSFVGPWTFSREFMLDPQDIVGALFHEALFNDNRAIDRPPPAMKKVIVAIDPSWGTMGDECGIVVVGLGVDNLAYVLEDLSFRGPPLEWGKTAASAFRRWQADQIISEAAFGSEQVKIVMNQVAPTLPLTVIPANKTAGQGQSSNAKARRFEPVRVLFEQGKVQMAGVFPALEAQACSWTEESHFSPDRVDALAYALWYLMLGAQSVPATVYRPKGRIPTTGTRLRAI